MYIELLDILRCTVDHRQIPLVTAIIDRDGRFVVNAVMGCPVCRQEYPIENGVALFGSHGGSEAEHGETTDEADPELAVRVAAFLNPPDAAVVALIGEWAPTSAAVAEMTGTRVFAVNSPVPLEESERVGVLRAARRLPFAADSLRGIAIGEGGWSGRDVEAAAGALAAGGRMVLPVSIELPAGLDEVAHDDAIRVAEKRGPLVALHRR